MAGPRPEESVTRPVALMRWEALTFLHWPYPPTTVQDLLPDGLRVDTWDGSAWVAITPFVMSDVRAPGLPALPVVSTFPETNVRTYVRDRSGRDGIWFFSLDTTRVAALAARAVGIPYMWSSMTVHRGEDRVHYETKRRRIPRGAHLRSRIEVHPQAPVAAPELGDLDHFLTGRWRAFSVSAGQLFCTPVEHQPWPLWHAETSVLDFNVVAAVGLPPPGGAPIVHYSPGVDVRMGRTRRLAPSGF